ncbi:MAG: hypothetical protein R3E84_05950 [Pseudomonadales bacterium]
MQSASIIVTVLLTAVIVAALIFLTAERLTAERGMSGRRGGHRLIRSFARRRTRFTNGDDAVNWLAIHLQLDTQQVALLSPMAHVFDAWHEDVHAIREASGVEPATGDVLDQQFDRATAMLARTAEALNALRDAATPLQACLSPTQRERLNRLFNKKYHHRDSHR